LKTIWILGDQLSADNPALAASDPGDSVVLLIESKARGSCLRYHKKKLVLVYSAMRHFAADLRRAGWQVDYHELINTPDFTAGLKQHLKHWDPKSILITEPNDWPMTDALQKLRQKISIPIEVLPTNRFLVSREEFRQWARNSERLVMESHYRRLRRKTGYLMTHGQPIGGAWNFDVKNRQTFSNWIAGGSHRAKRNPESVPDAMTRKVMELVEAEFSDHPGSVENFWLPVTRSEAVQWLEVFIRERLPEFGSYQDLMVAGERTHFHSVLSPLLNLGLLNPRECVEAAIKSWEEKAAPLNAVEGFVRQIIGWREFINGVYWLRMPEYKNANHFKANRSLPPWCYTGKVEMNCLREVLTQVIESGYNHHIQRLMVLGNFFLLTGINPREVDRWFLEMYVDAYDWVMAANVYGMILFADGGFMATKPYAASGAYINKMSNYCEACRFKPSVKTGPTACPYNYLYWNFFATQQENLAKNPRIRLVALSWDRKTTEEKRAIKRDAKIFLEKLN
jgi:deoxyribodipyrimidine photolyase-related protein